MCTVTFIPDGNTFFITSNRDESPSRKSKGLLSAHPPGKHTIHYPLDEESGGSWIAMADSGKVGCLLNGAFEPFTPNPPYRQSRGRVVIDAVMATDTDAFLETYTLEGIAPFTFILFEQNKLTELIWDGSKKLMRDLSIAPAIWSSVTLYPPEVRKKRKELFEHWLSRQPSFTQEAIIDFHTMQPGDPLNDFVMNRDNVVRTLSITSAKLEESRASMVHLDLDHQTRDEILVRHD